jgi:hypothetical protein
LAPCHADANPETSNADAAYINSHAETCDADATNADAKADAKAESQHDPRRHSDTAEYRKRNHH